MILSIATAKPSIKQINTKLIKPAPPLMNCSLRTCVKLLSAGAASSCTNIVVAAIVVKFDTTDEVVAFAFTVFALNTNNPAKARIENNFFIFSNLEFRLVNVLKIKKNSNNKSKIKCREEGIRTLDTLLVYTHFPGVRLRPLGHLSSLALKVAQITKKILVEEI